MKKEELYEAIGDISENYIQGARMSTKKRPPVWIKWTAMAACLCLVVTAAFALNILPSLGPEEHKDDNFAHTIAYVGWSEDQMISDGAINKELLQSESEVHLPVFVMDTLDELEQFRVKYRAVLNLEQGFDNIPSFEGALSKAQFDTEGFFQNYTLLAIYIPASSSSFRFGVKDIAETETSVCIYIEQTNNPELVTDDMAGWIILMCVEDGKVGSDTSIDAIYDVK